MENRKVTNKGSINLDGKEYQSEKLLPYAGTEIKAFVDDSINKADAVCFDLDGEFITNAQNEYLWKEVLNV